MYIETKGGKVMQTSYRYVEDVRGEGKEWSEGVGGGSGVLVIMHVRPGGTPPDVKKREEEYEKYINEKYFSKNE